MDYWFINGFFPLNLLIGLKNIRKFIKLSDFVEFYKKKNKKNSKRSQQKSVDVLQEEAKVILKDQFSSKRNWLTVFLFVLSFLILFSLWLRAVYWFEAADQRKCSKKAIRRSFNRVFDETRVKPWNFWFNRAKNNGKIKKGWFCDLHREKLRKKHSPISEISPELLWRQLGPVWKAKKGDFHADSEQPASIHEERLAKRTGIPSNILGKPLLSTKELFGVWVLQSVQLKDGNEKLNGWSEFLRRRF